MSTGKREKKAVVPVFLVLSYFITPLGTFLNYHAFQGNHGWDVGPAFAWLLIQIITGFIGIICLVISEQRKEDHPYWHYGGFLLNLLYITFLLYWAVFRLQG